MTFKMHKYILPSLQGRGLGVGLLLACFLLTGCGLYKNYERPADLRTDGLYGSAQVGNRTPTCVRSIFRFRRLRPI